LADIVLVRTANSIIYDPRVKKIVGSLSKRYSISVLGWNRDSVSEQTIKNYAVKLELFKLKTSIWKPSSVRIFARLIFFAPPFWAWVLIRLLVIRPKVVHACDLDSVLPCYIYKLLLRKKLVFDVFDRYAITFIPKKFRMLYRIINFTEEFFSKHSDVLIVANGENVLRSFQKKPSHCEILLNYPDDNIIGGPQGLKKNDFFTIAFTGHIRRNRGLEKLTHVIRDLKDIRLLITGRIEDELLFNEIQNIQNVKYLGLVDDSALLEIEASSNMIVAFYDPVFFSNNMPLPNKIFEAMMCSTPVVTNVAHEIVNETNCGLVVEYDNVKQIKETIISLRDNPQLCRRLGDNGRKAFLEKYNWSKMEQKLYKVYERLLSNDSKQNNFKFRVYKLL
jgi:glycosyltransferase involved in cell wall biosynthesis